MSIKIDRAMKLSTTGRYPQTFFAMLAHVSPSVIESVSGRTLAHIIDDLYDASAAAKAIAASDIVDAGAVWDARRQCHRDIAA